MAWRSYIYEINLNNFEFMSVVKLLIWQSIYGCEIKDTYMN